MTTVQKIALGATGLILAVGAYFLIRKKNPVLLAGQPPPPASPPIATVDKLLTASTTPDAPPAPTTNDALYDQQVTAANNIINISLVKAIPAQADRIALAGYIADNKTQWKGSVIATGISKNIDFRYLLVYNAAVKFKQQYGRSPLNIADLNMNTPADVATLKDTIDRQILSAGRGFDGAVIKISHDIPTPPRSEMSYDRYDFDGVFANINSDVTRLT